MIRGFEKISALKDVDIPLPTRGTKFSAGYDVCIIHPEVFEMIKQGISIDEAWDIVTRGRGETLVWKVEGESSIIFPTGIKAYMQPDEYLLMCIRSSSGIKKGIRQSNPPSIIDADYYNNPENEGHIMVGVNNSYIEFTQPIMRIAQGVFQKYLVTDDDNVTTERVGGQGSTKK